MHKDFDKFISQLRETNQTLPFFCDFNKIKRNVEDVKLSLCMLNSLIGTTDLRRSVEAIWNRDKEAFAVMDILIAVRRRDKTKVLTEENKCIPLERMFSSVDEIITFLEATGLAEIMQQQKVNDLVDYVFGIETGLDSNARKNRSGEIMEHTVSKCFDEANMTYRKEVYSSEWAQIADALGTDKKRFDFVIETNQTIYLIETNFYNKGGSKLNEVARAYSDIAPKINAVGGFEFVWITDGVGWLAAKNKLQEAYNIIPSIYNLTTIQHFINRIKQE